MTTLLLQPTSTAEWHALVNEAEVNCHLELGEDLESYLVFLLMRFAGKPELTQGIMALEFLDALHKHGHSRSEQLRDVGDKCLLFAGLFPGLAKRRRLQINYFIDLGRNAYYVLSSVGPHEFTDLYAQLSEEFSSMREVLLAMRIDYQQQLKENKLFRLLVKSHTH